MAGASWAGTSDGNIASAVINATGNDSRNMRFFRHNDEDDHMLHAAEIRVMLSAAFKEAYLELVPQFERATGHKVTPLWMPTVKRRRSSGRRAWSR
jgi:hypothetical protein